MAQASLGPFRVRLWHVLFGHDHHASVLVDKLRSEKHPNSDKDFIYTVNLMRCRCGLHFIDAGVEFRDDSWKRKYQRSSP